MTLHRCSERECPHFGQRTDRSCGCHRTDEEMLREAVKELADALEAMVEEKADYMLLNNLGDPEQQHTVKVARAALAKGSVA